MQSLHVYGLCIGSSRFLCFQCSIGCKFGKSREWDPGGIGLDSLSRVEEDIKKKFLELL